MDAGLLTALAGLALMHLLAAATPGPSIAMVSYVAARSRRAGLLAAAGIVVGSLTWVVLCLLGVGAVLMQAGAIYHALRLIGAAYLVYLGVRMLIAAARRVSAGPAATPRLPSVVRHPFTVGVMTTFSNPKSVVFWTSLFIVAVPPEAPAWFYAATVAVILVQATAWYGFVALALSTDAMRRVYGRIGRWIDGATGAVMVALGFRLAAEVRQELAR
jgi:threonine efflux protein